MLHLRGRCGIRCFLFLGCRTFQDAEYAERMERFCNVEPRATEEFYRIRSKHTLHTHRPLAAILELGSSFAGANALELV